MGTYPPNALDALKPLFVSRAPQRRNGGAAHKDTIYAQPERLKTQGGVTQKVLLTNLSLKDLDNLIDPHRNEKLYAAIRERLEVHGGKGDKAFPASNPLRKPDRDGNSTGPVVRTVTKVIDKKSGIPIRGGLAKNDSMLRVDVFTKGGKFHLIPVYVHHRVNGLPDRAIVAFKDEAEWTQIDESFAFCFSLHPNDLIRVTQRSGETISIQWRPTVMGGWRDTRQPGARHAHGLQGRTLRVSSWLHLLKSWSLLKTRGGSRQSHSLDYSNILITHSLRHRPIFHTISMVSPSKGSSMFLA